MSFPMACFVCLCFLWCLVGLAAMGNPDARIPRHYCKAGAVLLLFGAGGWVLP